MGDHHDETVDHIFSRREAMRLGLISTASLLGGRVLLAAPTTQPSDPAVAAAPMTTGPFFNDEKLNRSDLIGDTNRAAVTGGVPLTLTLAFYRAADRPEIMRGVQVDLWQCDATGAYSGENQPALGVDTTGLDYLRGYQITGDDGTATFQTILPGWYPGRSPHLHFLVRTPGDDRRPGSWFASQLYFEDGTLDEIYKRHPYRGPADTNNARDFIYQQPLEDGTAAGVPLTLELEPDGRKGAAYRSALGIVLAEESFRPLRRR